jgi:hypothetical protein
LGERPGLPRRAPFLRLAEALGVPAERLAEEVDDPATSARLMEK